MVNPRVKLSCIWLLFSCIWLVGADTLPLDKIEGKCVQPKDFSRTQKQVIIKAFKYGAPSGYGYTMAAIAWKESCAGEYRVNFSDPSAGIYHAHIPGIIKKYKQKDSSFMRNMVGELLMRDDEFASKSALEELEYWHKARKGNWYEVIKSYNKGFSWDKDSGRNAMAQAYFEDVASRVKALQTYIPKHVFSYSRLAKGDYALAFLSKAVQTNALSRQNERVRETKDALIQQKAKAPSPSRTQDFIILEE